MPNVIIVYSSYMVEMCKRICYISLIYLQKLNPTAKVIVNILCNMETYVSPYMKAVPQMYAQVIHPNNSCNQWLQKPGTTHLAVENSSFVTRLSHQLVSFSCPLVDSLSLASVHNVGISQIVFVRLEVNDNILQIFHPHTLQHSYKIEIHKHALIYPIGWSRSG